MSSTLMIQLSVLHTTDFDVDEMINKTKIGKIIQGVRGESTSNMDKIKNTIKSVAQMMLDHKEITAATFLSSIKISFTCLNCSAVPPGRRSIGLFTLPCG